MSEFNNKQPLVRNVPAIVTCVEAGPLEQQVLRMVESLRRWGGRLSEAPVLAVRPRGGPALRTLTFQRFNDLNIEFVDVRHDSSFGWYKFLNKPIAVTAAAEWTDAETICWLDADILIVQEPAELMLDEDEDFAANCSDIGGLASSGPASEHEPYWQRACSVLGLELDQLPWLVPHRGPGDPVRFYFNGGVFTFRRSTNFAQHYMQAVEQMLVARFAHPQHRCYFHEQAALGLAAIKHSLRWRELTAMANFSSNAMLGSHLEQTGEASVLHYHGSLNPNLFEEFVGTLERFHLNPAAWLRDIGPLDLDLEANGLMTRSVGIWRKVQQELYLKRCEVVCSRSNTEVFAA